MLDFIELLKLKGLNTSKKIKMVRHMDKRFDIKQLIRDGLFELYQSYQKKGLFNCEYIVVCIG